MDFKNDINFKESELVTLCKDCQFNEMCYKKRSHLENNKPVLSCDDKVPVNLICCDLSVCHYCVFFNDGDRSKECRDCDQKYNEFIGKELWERED